MYQKLQQWMYNREVLAGVERGQKDGQPYYQLCVLKKEKDNAMFVLQRDHITSIETLKNLLEPDTPIFLSVTIKGVLNRVLDYVPSSTEEALATIFPAAQVEDFHYQQIEGGEKTLMSVVRRDSMVEIIEEFEAAGLWVVKAFVGPFWIEHLLPFLGDSVERLQVGQHLLSIEQEHIISWSKGEKEALERFVVGEDRVSEPLLLALSMAFLAVTQPTIEGLDIALVKEKEQAFYYKKLFYYTAIGALGFFFVVLLGNYLLFERYSGQQQHLSLEVDQQKSLLDQRAVLAKKYQDKKALLGDQLNLGQSKSSYYADQLAATLPSSLQLTDLVLFPALEQENDYSSEEQLPRYDSRTLIIKGQCQASVFYNNWKRSLEALDWIASIHNVSYQNNKDGQGVFELKITLKND